VTRLQGATAWFCALALVIVLANRVPRISISDDARWVPSTPSQMTAKILAKDFFVLLPPASGAITLVHAAPSPVELSEENPIVFIFLDNRLFTRPPPTALTRTAL
jgi:hypothetical protein